MNRKTELLAPAGSFAILKAVVNAGADAVYASGTRFGARAYADNFTKEEMLAAIDYIHLKGKRLYLTVNTLLKEQEAIELYDYLAPFYEAGLDAVIVQDFGVLQILKDYFPKLPIHASTQMTVMGAYGAKLLLEAGCSRIVTSRELSLHEISNIVETTGAEIESFVHGALCYCYSGQCLLSSLIGGRSGNRGRCAQPCRLSYELFESKESAIKSRKQKENFLLSPKDLCTVDIIPELIKSGVHSFKIEGRMKQAEYAAGVTSIYRKYIDQYEKNPAIPYRVEEKDRQMLLDLGSRCGFTEGYYKQQNGKDMITFSSPSHEKRNETLHDQIRSRYIEMENKEKVKGILRLFAGKPAELVLKYKEIQVAATGEVVQIAGRQPLSKEIILEKMKKTGNTPFQFDTLTLEMGENIFFPVGALNQLRRAGLQKLAETVQEPYRRNVIEKKNHTSLKQEDKVKENFSSDRYESVEGRGEESLKTQRYDSMESQKNEFMEPKNPNLLGIRLSILTETLAQFEVALEQQETDRIYLEAFALERKQFSREWKTLVSKVHKAKKECCLALPYVFRMETAHWYETNWKEIAQAGADGYLIRNLEELSFLRDRKVDTSKIQGDYNLYCYSNEAIQGLGRLSLSQYTLPAELNRKEIKNLDCSKGEILVYGFQPLMLSAQCLHKNTSGCDKKKGVFYLKDRYGNLFPVKSRCEDCYNIIYNISPLSLFHHYKEIRQLEPAGVRISFTLENQVEVEQIFSYYRQALKGTLDREHYLKDFTNGHFKRGVE